MSKGIGNIKLKKSEKSSKLLPYDSVLIRPVKDQDLKWVNSSRPSEFCPPADD